MMGKIERTPDASTATPAASIGSPELQAFIVAVAKGTAARDAGELPTREVIDRARGIRLGALRLGREEGGGGASLPDLFALVIDLAQADPNVPHILRNHFAFVETALRTRRNVKYSRWLDHVRAGRFVGLGASELGIPNIGSGRGETRLEERDGQFVLNGTKYYSTGNFYSDFIFVNASTPDGRPVSALVPTDAPGVSVDDDWDGIGQQRTASGTSVFKDVAVDRDAVIFTAEEDLKLPYFATFQQLYLTAIVAGIVRNVVDDAAALVKRRDRNFYHAVEAQPAADPLLQQSIGRLASIAYVAEAAVLRAAEALGAAYQSAIDGEPDADLFEEAALRAAKAKVVIDDLALGAATQLFEVGGASAARQRERLDRHWRNIRTITAHNPVSYKARAIGNRLLNGVPLPNAAFF
ncbi:acyl-CoA dehydrogenase family protein [Xanthobacter oligotrophicus]|uniref:acyl-CoA dehydrogenase family protein n=1 Tax=Xanthobacter oligotrophicus TaxID=2607286 RepID=UPI001AEE9BE8|nr:acyl-CoA dehydrogenase family protein [Xanthobacter oligotrophicus]MCG5237857.1 acyl-CoA dehydrogenase family protein [Xanthobacter oligotrophicus]